MTGSRRPPGRPDPLPPAFGASSSHGRLEGLDAGRGIAALLVVVFHALLVFEPGGVPDYYELRLGESHGWVLVQNLILVAFNGPACVTLFFVLSGTVLSLGLQRAAPLRPADILGYYVKRGFRLYPLLVLAALLAAAVQATLFGPETFALASTWFDASFKVPPEDLPAELFANAIGRSATLNGPAWSIKVELLASALFPALYLLALSPLAAAPTLAALIAAMFAVPEAGAAYHHLPVFLVCFFAGALVPRYGRRPAAAFAALPRGARIAAVVAAAVALMLTRRVVAPAEFVVPGVLLVETVAATFLVAVVMFGPERRLYRSAPLRRVAELSYGLYLLHCIVLASLARIALPFMPERLGGPAALGAGLLLAVATLAVTLPLAHVVHRRVEAPMQRLGQRLAARIAGRTGSRRDTSWRGVATDAPCGGPPRR